MLVRGSTFDRGKPSEIPAYFFSEFGCSRPSIDRSLVRPSLSCWIREAGGEIATPTTRQGQGKRPRQLLKNFGIFFSGQEIRGAMTCFNFLCPVNYYCIIYYLFIFTLDTSVKNVEFLVCKLSSVASLPLNLVASIEAI